MESYSTSKQVFLINNVKFYKQLTCTVVFNKNLISVFNTLKDLPKTNLINNKYQEGFASETIFTKHSHSWEQGAEFSFLWKNTIKPYFRTHECKLFKDHAKITFHVYKSIPSTIEHGFSYTLYPDHTGLFTTIVVEFFIKNDLIMQPEGLEKLKSENFYLFKNIEKYMTDEENENQFIQRECVYINSDLENIIKIISNLKILRKFVPILCDSVKIEGEIKTGTVITLKWKKKPKSKVKLRVTEIKLSHYSFSIFYDCIDAKPKVPNQKIVWSCTKKEGEFCLVEFSHFYKESLNKELLASISQMKKKILKNLREQIEMDDLLSNLSDNIIG
jgi:hypothetical protein